MKLFLIINLILLIQLPSIAEHRGTGRRDEQPISTRSKND